MKLVDLKYDFVNLSQSEQRAAFFEYYDFRAIDLAKPPVHKKKAASPRKKKGPQIKVSPEQLELLQKLKLV